jgi:preprotein translocase subunit SecY
MALGALANIGKVPELRRRLIFSLGMIAVYRVGVAIPTPGIDGKAMQAFFAEASNDVFGLVNLFN